MVVNQRKLCVAFTEQWSMGPHCLRYPSHNKLCDGGQDKLYTCIMLDKYLNIIILVHGRISKYYYLST